MAYCGPRGIPHSKFLSWNEDDQDKAIAWTLGESAKCSACGTVSSEWLDQEGREIIPPPYEIKSILCVGCATLKQATELVPEEDRHKYHLYLAPRQPSRREG